MPNTFITLDTPKVINAAGTPTNVATTGHPKSFVLTGPVTGRYVVEGSNDGGQSWDILIDDNDGTQVLFTSQNEGAKTVDCIVEQVRVRGIRNLTSGDGPAITMGAPPALAPNFFGKLDVPAAPGLGAILDLGLTVGPLKTFIVRGAVPERARFTVLASMDGARFDEAILFTSDQQGARSVSVMCRFLRVQRTGAGGPPPVLAVGAEPVLEAGGSGGGGGGPDGPFISFGDESAKTTTSVDQEEVLEELAVPGTSLPGAAAAVVVSFSALVRKATAAGEPVTLRLRVGGQPGAADGAELASVQAASTLEQPLVARSAPIPRPGAALFKVTGQGNGLTRPVLRGLVVQLEPAPAGPVIT
jgi:hypothetical protein